MNTKNIKERIMAEQSDVVEGVSGRWTFFTKLYSQVDPQASISTPVFAIDSAEEMKLGIGRLFEPKEKIRAREAIVSHHNMKVLQASVGDNVTFYYDIKLILNMIQ